MDDDAPLKELTHDIIAAAIEVHRALGPGLLESAYKRCLLIELAERRLLHVAERSVPLAYKGHRIDVAYRVDLIVEEQVVVEVKCLDRLLGIHEAQLLTYLKLTGCPVGLLINFNVPKLTDGVKRMALTKPRT